MFNILSTFAELLPTTLSNMNILSIFAEFAVLGVPASHLEYSNGSSSSEPKLASKLTKCAQKALVNVFPMRHRWGIVSF